MAINRRTFVAQATIAGAGLVIGVRLSSVKAFAQENEKGPKKPVVNPFDAYIHVKPDGKISLIVAKSEMGQGIKTGLAMLLAEEAEVDFNSVSVEQAETRPDIYAHMGTGGSGSTMENFMPLRRAGATVRELMITAAAQKWNVPKNECKAKNGAVVYEKSSQRATYGELVEAAQKLPLPDPEKVELKDEADFDLIGHATPRVDIPSKVNGSAVFGLDVRVPEMLFAVVARCPTFGGKHAHFDATKAKAVPGVKQVFEIPALGRDMFTAGGVAVVADSTWAAMQGRDALQIQWDNGAAAAESTSTLHTALHAGAAKAGKRVRNDGDVDAVLSNGAKRVEATYEFPFLAHATMEPMNITVHARSGEAEVWAPTQSPDWVQRTVAKILDLKPEKVVVHTTFMGGGFGRRYMADYPAEASQIAKVVGKPVQLVWSREDDMTHDFYRPAACHQMKGAVDQNGRPLAWSHTIASTSIGAYWDPPEHQAPEKSEVGGAEQMPYAIPNVRLEYNHVASAVPPLWWRSVEHSFNGFAVECFIDELAAAAGQDAVQFRKTLLVKPANWKAKNDEDPDPARLRAIMELAAEKSGWGTPLPKGKGRGIATYHSFGSYICEVAEVTVQGNSFKVDRMVAAIDCGQIVNPESVRAQAESAIIYGLSAALKNEITVKNGAIEQTNFDGYDPVRISEAPPIEVHLMKSKDEPGGMGEPALPPAAPAVANAIFAACGKRVRKLPFQLA
ncbi:MAG TPA: molybdopterin cofactor-binding domain-containing protein [Candidatus Sulfotelmatobacter sp.]|jgi:isoquinoline 1-oxidoreductase beta subunit|nr:molybdopterin cofactor-binding domain-containing protein [Candidatus Sulfotelmatobacter sp.]